MCLSGLRCARGCPCPVAGRSLRPSWAFAHSMLTSLRHPWLRLSATPALGHGQPLADSRSTGCQPVCLFDSRFSRDGERISLHGPWKAVRAYRGLEGRVFAFVSHLGWATERISLHGPWKAVRAYTQQRKNSARGFPPGRSSLAEVGQQISVRPIDRQLTCWRPSEPPSPSRRRHRGSAQRHTAHSPRPHHKPAPHRKPARSSRCRPSSRAHHRSSWCRSSSCERAWPSGGR